MVASRWQRLRRLQVLGWLSWTTARNIVTARVSEAAQCLSGDIGELLAAAEITPNTYIVIVTGDTPMIS